MTENNSKKELFYSNLTIAVKPLVRVAAIFGLAIVSYTGNYIQELKWYQKVYSIILGLAVISCILLIPPSNIVHSKPDLMLGLITTFYVTSKLFEVFYILITTNFVNTSNCIDIFKYLDRIDSKSLSPRGKELARKQLVFHVYLVFFWVLVLFTGGVLIWRLTSQDTAFYNNIPLLFIIIMTSIQTTTIALLLQNMILRFIFLNMVLLRLAKKYDPERVFMIEKKKTFADIAFGIMFPWPYLSVDDCFNENCYNFETLSGMYDLISETLRLFNSVFGTQTLLMITTAFLCTLLIIVRNISPLVEKSLSSDTFWYMYLNCRIIVVAIFSDVIQSQCHCTWLLVNDLLLCDALETEERNQLKDFAVLMETHKNAVSAIFFDLDLQLIVSFAGTATSYSALFSQSYYSNQN